MASNTAYLSSTYKRLAPALLLFFTRARGKSLVFAFWIIVVACYWYSTQNIAPTAIDKIKLLCDIAVKHKWGPVIFVVAYALQPLVFFPTFLMTIAAGILYGPLWGMGYSIIGANAAATISYGVGRALGAKTLGHLVNHPRVSQHVERLRSNTFETILILGLLHAPFDIMNFVSGMLRLRWRQFALGTAIAMIPGGLPFVLFGSSLGNLDSLTATGRPELNIPLLALSIIIALLAVVVSHLLRKRVQ